MITEEDIIYHAYTKPDSYAPTGDAKEAALSLTDEGYLQIIFSHETGKFKYFKITELGKLLHLYYKLHFCFKLNKKVKIEVIKELDTLLEKHEYGFSEIINSHILPIHKTKFFEFIDNLITQKV